MLLVGKMARLPGTACHSWYTFGCAKQLTAIQTDTIVTEVVRLTTAQSSSSAKVSSGTQAEQERRDTTAGCSWIKIAEELGYL